MTSRALIKKIIGPLFILLIVIFLLLYLRDIDLRILRNLSINWWLLGLASIISLGFRYWGVIIWRYILQDLGAKQLPHFSLLADVYAKAWMARYIPGTITWIAGKIYMASKLGISKSRLTVSSILEGGVQIVATMSLSLFILGLDSRLDIIPFEAKILLVIIALGSLCILLPPVLNRLLAFVFKVVRKKTAYAELTTNNRATIRSYILYVVGALISGSAYYFLALSIYPEIDLSSYWFIVGAFTLAGALGMATPLVPSGLGVREGIQLVLLSLIMPKEVALAITVLSRLWSVAVDVVFYVLTRLMVRISRS